MYLGDDPALFNLVPDPDGKRAFLKNPNVVLFEHDYGSQYPQGSSISTNIQSIHHQHLKNHSDLMSLNHSSSSSSSDMYEVVFNITLEPLNKKKTSKSMISSVSDYESSNLDGLWSNPTGMKRTHGDTTSGNGGGGGGGFIHVESNGIHIKFTEVPKMRQWGTTEALLIGGKLRYADFRDHTSPHLYTPASTSATSFKDGVDLLAQDAPQYTSQHGHGLDTGSIFITSLEPGRSSSESMSIHWKGRGAWFKQPNPLKYRFLKLIMYGTTRKQDVSNTPYEDHLLNIHEIQFYKGFSSLTKIQYQTGKDGHVEEKVKCSSAQET